ncbi:MAG TPA: hypothetical protein VMA53_22805 [Stellaceae bacterium]|nr:hypothetical protein [Stellaceae bacterium]
MKSASGIGTGENKGGASLCDAPPRRNRNLGVPAPLRAAMLAAREVKHG